MDFEMDEKNLARRDFVRGGVLAAAGLGGAQALANTSPVPAGVSPVKLLRANRTVSIPGDYPTLQEAVRRESEWYPCEGVRIVLRIEAGHRIKSGARFWNGSFGHFCIVSDDAVAEVDDDFTGTLIFVRRAIGPVLATMVDMRGRGGNGYWCEASFGYIEEAHLAGKICGIRNAGRDGVGSVHASNMRIGERDDRDNPDIKKHGEVSGSGRFNIHCMGGSTVSARHAILSNAKETNVLSTHTSMVTCDLADCSGAAKIGVHADLASQIDAAYVNASNCGEYGLYCSHVATMRAVGATVTNSGQRDIRIRRGGMIDVSNVQTTQGTPSIEDTTVTSFNQVFGQGILFNESV